MELVHEARLVPPVLVKPFVKRQKSDAAAAAICVATVRPTMRFIPVKPEERQSRRMVFRFRYLLVCKRMRTANALRGHLAELGIIAPEGIAGAEASVSLPEVVRATGQTSTLAERSAG